MPHGSPPRSARSPCQLPDAGIRAAAALAGRPAKQHQLQLDDAASQLLCYCYEGNLLALAQALERLALLWPDGKLTLPRVEQAVNDAAHFTPYHWVDALLAVSACCTSCSSYALKAASRRSCCVLCSGSCCCWLPSSAATHTPLRSLFDKHRVWQNRRQLLSDAPHARERGTAAPCGDPSDPRGAHL